MDAEMKKAFKKWWKTLKLPNPKTRTEEVMEIASMAFEEGWGCGVSATMELVGAKLSKMGRVRPRNAPTIIEIKGEDTSPVMGNIGKILRKKGEKSGKTD